MRLGNTAIIIFCLLATTVDGLDLVVFGQALPLLPNASSVELSAMSAGLLGAIVNLGSLSR